jgi:hypothetical protein
MGVDPDDEIDSGCQHAVRSPEGRRCERRPGSENGGARLAEAIGRLPATEALRRLNAAGAVAGPVNSAGT